MKARLCCLIPAFAVSLMAGYTYDSTWIPGGSTTPWQSNGGATFGSSSITFGSGGSIIYKSTVSGANPNDYEVESQLPAASGANYVHFLRANSTSVAGRKRELLFRGTERGHIYGKSVERGGNLEPE